MLSVALKAALPPGPACPPLCCQRNPQPLQSTDLQFILLYLEFSLELCCATGSVIPHVFYVSRRGFRVLCWRIKALFGGTCSLTIQLDKLNFPCNLNRLCQNVNCARLQSYLLTPQEHAGFPSHPYSPVSVENNSFECLCPSPIHSPGKLLWLQCVLWDNPGHLSSRRFFPPTPACVEVGISLRAVFTFIRPRNSSSLRPTI